MRKEDGGGSFNLGDLAIVGTFCTLFGIGTRGLALRVLSLTFVTGLLVIKDGAGDASVVTGGSCRSVV